ncbi:hypothetical protein H477_0039 [[Clostridium] sordellii ATCC 9714]|nr:hypothetical protein H477_0039 [[Clostridium] sordellii ATCC 9714] [Paeniclostridium sordellii ATCC 9714]
MENIKELEENSIVEEIDEFESNEEVIDELEFEEDVVYEELNYEDEDFDI